MEPDLDTLMFFDGHSGVLPLYEQLETLLYQEFPEVHKRAGKTQITLTNRYVFACVSFARVRRKSELPDNYLVLTLGLAEGLSSDQVAVKTEPYPGHWTYHFVLSRPEDLDEELLSWIRGSCAFTNQKR